MSEKTGRNDPCPCGSGKKFKACCLKAVEDLKVEYLDPHLAFRKCTWCNKEIAEDSEVFSLGARGTPGLTDALKEDTAIRLTLILASRKVTAIIPSIDSQAKMEGNDILFTICSRSCGMALKEALDNEKQILETLGNVN